MKKRILSLLLAFVLLAGLLPAQAAAAETPTFDAYFSALGLPAAVKNATSATLRWKTDALAGETVLKSPSGFQSSTGAFSLTFTSDTHLTFEYKISSEEKYDYFSIKYDGKSLTDSNNAAYSGVVDWTTY